MKKTLAALAVLFAFALFSGCATPSLGVEHPHAITGEKVGKVKTGATTRDDLDRMFGEPEMKIPTPEGVSYFYKDLNLNSFWALFSDDWILIDYEWSD
ncbi:MAG: hypothetical protein ACNS63_08185 [Candidatus Nitrospinota bacterium M3_3B_026]